MRKAIFVLVLVLLYIVRLQFPPIPVPFAKAITPPLLRMRDVFARSIARALPEPQASYANGLLLGAKDTLPREIRDAFRATGTSHLVALSGYNVTILTKYLGGWFRALPMPILAVVIFVLATGAASSLVRAAVMGVLLLVADRYVSAYDARSALGAAVGLMLFFDPALLIRDIGFQLSVAATYGLIAFASNIERRLSFVPKIFGMRESLAVTLAAQAATFPIIMYYFGRISLLAPLANMFVLIAVPLTMFFSFLTGLAALVSPAVGVLVAWPSYLLLTYQLLVIRFFADIHVF